MPSRVLSLLVLLPLVAGLVVSTALAQPTEFRKDPISAGAEAIDLARRVTEMPVADGPGISPVAGFTAGANFLGYDFDDNATETGGFLFIPPDPCGAAGLDRVIAVTNVGIECRTKAGALIWRDALRDFVIPAGAVGAGTLGSFTFDPKIVYDHYEDRFVVVTLERNFIASGDPSNESRIIVAVSKTSAPATATAADWWYYSIDSKISIGGNDHWADYPGFEVDEEVVYITNNMFPFPGGAGSGGVRLWIIHKGAGGGGFYDGGATTWTIHDPPTASGGFALTMMPALVFGAGGAGSGIGTYLCSYSSLTFGGVGGLEAAQIIRVDNPTGAVSFSSQFVTLGDLEDVGGVFGFPALPDAPQSGTAIDIEVNDSRALDAVWRDNNLWFTTTINPNAAQSPANVGQATAHWFRLDTTTPATITVADQGNIGGEDIATDTWTFFPSVAVNGSGDAKFGFSASAATIFPGAYFAGREAGDPAGTVQPAGVIQAGLDYYIRTFGTPGVDRNRWGDYSGASVDPSDDETFWLNNQYAMARGTLLGGEDGRWGTAWIECTPDPAVVLDWGDAPDGPYPTLAGSGGANHVIVPGIFMGPTIDGEPDGQPTVPADGDDLAGIDDEDGVFFVTPIFPGGLAQIDVICSTTGFLDAWIDFNGDGIWGPADLIYSGPAAPGVNNLVFAVPPSALVGLQTYARVRFNQSFGAGLPPGGPAPDGEVEDYLVFIDAPDVDYGDAPDPTYPTLLANNGARHNIDPTITIGGAIDSEPDGQPNASASGDDAAGIDDEDGVFFVTPLVPGLGSRVDVIVSVDGWLDMWIDFDGSGAWDPGEQIFSGVVFAGVNAIFYPVPAAAPAGLLTYSRARFNVGGALPVDGPAFNGEVEDDRVLITDPLDWGDAPDPTYPTLVGTNGAHHAVIPGVFMGNLIDPEHDGQPTPSADGDDLNGTPDEDGVTFVTPLTPGTVAKIDVLVSVDGWVNAWIDFDGNGIWDAAEEVANAPALAGVNTYDFIVPTSTPLGIDTFCRVRYNLAGPLPVDGFAPDGEVEDYLVSISTFSDAPDMNQPRFGVLMGGPNPFQSRFNIQFAIPEADHVEIKVFTMDGRLARVLVDEFMPAGSHATQWDGRDDRGRKMTNGVYFYRLRAGDRTETRKVMFMK